MSEGAPNGSSFAARQGTVAHAVGEAALRAGVGRAEQYAAMEALVGEVADPDYPDIRPDRDMLSDVRVYVDYCRQLQREAVFTDVELRVSLKALGYGRNCPSVNMFGTADFVAVTGPAGGSKTLHVVDYKHGSGITVEPADNPQLKYYAAGVIARLQETDLELLRTMNLVIVSVVQPRDDHLLQVRHHCYDIGALLSWVEDELLPAARRTQEPDAPLVVGEHCRFCPGQARCPERKRKQLEKAKMVFTEQDELIIPEKPASELSIRDLRVVLDSGDDIIAWVRACQKYAHESLENNSLTASDKNQIGYKLVKKRGMRKFKGSDEQTADALCEEFGLGDDELFTKKLRSPAQIEKEIGGAAIKKSAAWKQMIVSESSGTTLVRDDDNRPAVIPTSAKDKFAKVEDEDDDLI
jgi:hypothetical protein